MKRAYPCAVLLAAACCGPKGAVQQPKEQLTVPQIVDGLDKARAALTSFRGDSTMDYWVSGQRMKGEVLVMGKVGKFVRFAALSPAGGSTIVEMACDGTNFAYVNYQDNCALSGPCNAQSVAMFFRIELEPDEFLHLALGTPPTVANPTGNVTWDGGRGVWKVDLKGDDGAQKLSIDKNNDVVDSEMVGPDGKTRWSVANTDFAKRDGSGDRRVPGKTRFKSPAQNQDLLVEWNQFEANAQIPDSKFQLQIPQGLPTCGQQPGGAAGGAPPKAGGTQPK
jgi:hypothetical protein